LFEFFHRSYFSAIFERFFGWNEAHSGAYVTSCSRKTSQKGRKRAKVENFKQPLDIGDKCSAFFAKHQNKTADAPVI